MAKYHISPESGAPGVCNPIKTGVCKYGSVDHYESEAAARIAFEDQMSSETLVSHSKTSLMDKLRDGAQSMKDKGRTFAKFSPKLAAGSVLAGVLLSSTACGVQPSPYVEAQNNGQLNQPSISQTVKETKSQTLNQYVTAQQQEAIKQKAIQAQKDLKDLLQDPAFQAKVRDYGDKARDIGDKIITGLNEDFKEIQEQQGIPSAPSTTGSQTGAKYDRAAFKHWSNLDHKGCDTRQDILERDMTNVTYASDGCTVLSGTLKDPYTGQNIHYVKGNNSVDIDHITALSWAWSHGADSWSANKREAFANDPDNLLAVDSSANRAKGDQSPSTWVPSNRKVACDYSVHFLKVVKKYDLRVDQADVQSAKLACGK